MERFMLLVILLYAICASMFTISKWGLAYTEPIFFVGVRMVLAGTLLLGYLAARAESGIRLSWSDRKDWWLFAQIILFHIYLTYICDLCALKDISSIESAFIYNLSPFIAALISYWWFNEYMTRTKWAGLLLGFCGFLPQCTSLDISSLLIHAKPRLLTLAAVIASSYGWIVMRALVKKSYSPLEVNGIGMFFGGLAALATSYVVEPWSPQPVTDWIPFIQATVMIVVVANLLFYNLYGYLLSRYTATFLAFAGFMCPLFTALFGAVFLGETISSELAFSFIFVVCGLALFYSEEIKQGYVTK